MIEVNLPGEPDLSMIDEIPWVELSHAYGTAIDVPDQLRAVLDSDPEKRRSTFFSFTCNLFHQASVYPATVPAIGILQHLLRYKTVQDKSKILETLLAFAVGFPEDVDANVNVADFLGEDEDEEGRRRCDDPDARECYLAVGAGAPLYEALLNDDDPRTAISAAYMLAFFPAHGFNSCRSMLKVVHDDSQHDFVSSSAIVACSYLSGGPIKECYFETLSQLIENEKSSIEEPMPLLVAAATFAVLRETTGIVGDKLRAQANALADRCLKHDIALPACNFYDLADADDDRLDVQALLMPDPQFPWGSLVGRLQKLTGRKSAAIKKLKRRKSRTKRKSNLPNADSFDVRPDKFDHDNVVAAVKRYHASFIGERKNVVQAHKDFAPFKPHAMVAWDEMVQLLDSDEIEVRWAAASMIAELEELNETHVDQLIERLHKNNNNTLGSTVRKQSISERQCQDLLDRLLSGNFVRSEYSTNRDEYRHIVLEKGTNQQLWRLYEEGEDAERSMAISELMQRGQIDASDPRAFEAAVGDLLSNHFGRVTSAKFTFAKSESAQRWFFGSIDSLPKTEQWAVVEAMETFRADLTPLQEELVELIEAEENSVLQAKLVGLTHNLASADELLVDRLMKLLASSSSSLLRVAIVKALGSWIANPAIQQTAVEQLKTFLSDDSPRVRRATVDAIAECDDSLINRTAVFRDALSDVDDDNARNAMWHVCRIQQLSDADLALLTASEQSDRVTAETLIAITMNPNQMGVTNLAIDQVNPERPLTESITEWRVANSR